MLLLVTDLRTAHGKCESSAGMSVLMSLLRVEWKVLVCESMLQAAVSPLVSDILHTLVQHPHEYRRHHASAGGAALAPEASVDLQQLLLRSVCCFGR